jgi:hypothetical protein
LCVVILRILIHQTSCMPMNRKTDRFLINGWPRLCGMNPDVSPNHKGFLVLNGIIGVLPEIPNSLGDKDD